MMMPIIRGLAWTIGLAVARALLDYALDHHAQKRAERRSEQRLESEHGKTRLRRG
ncbi:hypothetical protein [Glycomyces artemisiae]|uniref:Uncharacterized protein n=1 Tax=Glycomyces artemisiae TaxID=1076443 RepID=A0A2T0U6C1_9ACTN|nr:hypothetical protein [Glycomyces artemisiae]PRY53432.1 hypothetical protein B0I28_1184 [Glycomyces artemisiae]